MDSMNRTCCTWLTGEQEPRQPGFHSWRDALHILYVKLPSEGCCDFFFFNSHLFCFSFLSVFFLAYFSVNHLLITYSLERPNAELVAPQNAENSFGSPQWNDLILMPGNAGQGPVLIWWIKPRRSSASELTDNYSEPLNLRGKGVKDVPQVPFLCALSAKTFISCDKGKNTQQAKPGIETCPSGWMEKWNSHWIFFFFFHFHG